MKCSPWNAMVLAIVLLAVAVSAAFNYKMDFYGLFGDVAGKKYVVYDNERTTKYLFGYNYIPSNFDGLLIGSSSSANWDTGKLSGTRMYNASINGGNITEEALVVDNILRRGRPKLVLFIIHPYLTETYGRKSGFMNQQEYWGALGSVQLLMGYRTKWLIERGYLQPEFNEFGRNDFGNRQPAVPNRLPSQVQGRFFVDPRSLVEYRDLVERVRRSGARVAAVIPPVSMQSWEKMQPAFSDYCSQIKPFFHEGEPVIDLNLPGAEEFRKNQSNYIDSIHLSREGARNVIRLVNDRLRQQGLVDAPTVGNEQPIHESPGR